MDLLKKFCDKLNSKSNILIGIISVVLLISVMFVYRFPESGTAILVACISCGLMQILQGMKYLGSSKKGTSGMPLILLGIIIVIVGFIIASIMG